MGIGEWSYGHFEYDPRYNLVLRIRLLYSTAIIRLPTSVYLSVIITLNVISLRRVLGLGTHSRTL
jgi:hypothetical protein